MTNELTRAKYIIDALKATNPKLLEEYSKKTQCEAIDMYMKLVRSSFLKKALEIERDKGYGPIIDLSRISVFGGDAAEQFDEILYYYHQGGGCKDADFQHKNIVLEVFEHKGLSHEEKALLILKNDRAFFNLCYDHLCIRGDEYAMYETYQGKSGVAIDRSNIENLKTSLGEYLLCKHRGSRDCDIDHNKVAGKDVFVINFNKGSVNQINWKNEQVAHEKTIPVRRVHIVYDSQSGKVEICLFQCRAKAIIFSIINYFGECVLGNPVNTSRPHAVFNLKAIQDDIIQNGDFVFKCSGDIEIEIERICYTKNGRKVEEGIMFPGDLSFLKKVQKGEQLSDANMTKVYMVARYKDGLKVKQREFVIDWGRTGLSHDILDTKIRSILSASGLLEVESNLLDFFRYIASENGLVNVHKMEALGQKRSVLETFKTLGILSKAPNAMSIYCAKCHLDTIAFQEAYVACGGCKYSIPIEQVDFTQYKLNTKVIKNVFCQYNGFTKDSRSDLGSYIGYLDDKTGESISVHVVDHFNDADSIEKTRNQIIMYFFGGISAVINNGSIVCPIVDYLSFDGKQNSGISPDSKAIAKLLKRVSRGRPDSVQVAEGIEGFIHQAYKEQL